MKADTYHSWRRDACRGIVAAGVLVGAAFLGAALLDLGAEEPTARVVTPVTPRFLTYIGADKQIYRSGESVYLRGTVLEHRTRAPGVGIAGIVKITGPKGDVVGSGQVGVEGGVWGYQWEIPEGQAGGEYRVEVTYPWQGHPPAERTFDIREYRAPRLKTQIEFVRDGYGAGDEVAATLEVERAEGGIPIDAAVTVIARVDGAEVYRGAARVDATGHCRAKFSLPEQIARGEGTLAMRIEDGGVVETASKSIPILLQTVDIQLYPEGGDLVQGLPNRVYFEAFTPSGKPADLAGVVLGPEDEEVATFRSAHEGRGRLEFTPRQAEGYRLKITEPSGIKGLIDLPKAKSGGVALQSVADTYAATDPIVLKIAGSDTGAYRVTLRHREQELTGREVALKRGEVQTVSLPLKTGDPDGVLIATVWADGKPLAERLVFRQPRQGLQIAVETVAADSNLVPGGAVKLRITTRDEKGQPVAAQVGLTVTDQSVLEMMERREQSPRLPVMVLLENDVEELADAHIYLDPDNADGIDAAEAIDLLLGVQGWRRFAWIDAEQFVQQHGDAARRVLAQLAAVTPQLGFGGGMGGFGGALGGGAEFDNFKRDAPGAAAPPAPAPAAPAGAEPDGAAPVDAAVPERAPEGAPGKSGAKEEEKKKGEKERLNFQAAPRGGDDKNAPAPQPPRDGKPAADDAPNAAGLAAPAAPQPHRDMDALPKLRKPMARQRLLQNELQDRAALEAEEPFGAQGLLNNLTPIRVYAHQVRSNRRAGERVDFAETLFWAAAVETNADGEATVEFGLNDAVTTFRVFAEGFDSRGALGAASSDVESLEPFYVEPKLPLEVTMGDRIQAPIQLVNATSSSLAGVDILVEAHSSQRVGRSRLEPFTIAAGERARKRMNVRVGDFNGAAEFTLTARAGDYQDRVTRRLQVTPLGFPIEDGGGSLLQPGGVAAFRVQIPDQLVAGSLRARATAHPTPLASMTAALERLIQEPGGCFEQTSSTLYPLIMAQQYFMSHEGVDPALIQRSDEIIDRGYKRLLGFESPKGGFEWFGGDPGHDALTAYGLLEFGDMSRVRDVDSLMLERTRNWLLAQRDGQGGFVRKTHTLHTWLAEPEVAFPYNTWALVEAGLKQELAKEIEWTGRTGEASDNSYVAALAANVVARGGAEDVANHLLDKLAGLQEEDGSIRGATTSVVGSGGQALVIETTALALTAWLTNDRYTEQAEKAIKFLAESCKSGRFGSTQSTVLALRAIVAYDQSRAKPKAPGQLELWVDGERFGEAVAFDTQTHGAIELPDVSALLTPGGHTVELRMRDGSPMPCVFSVNFNSLQPPSSEECRLHLEVKLAETEVDEGAATEARVTLVNRSDEKVPTPLAIVGIPGGLEVRHDQLKELVGAGTIDAYEVKGREVVLYWRVLDAEQRVEFPLSLIAAVAGKYTAPASRAYLYYTDEHKHWTPGLEATIIPVEQQ